jgi:glycosyltransferase involved in cell wall biosynthesis
VERINVLYLVRTWAIGGSHTIIFLLLRHLPQDRFNIICVPYDTPSKSDDAFVRAMKHRDLHVAEDRVPWHSRMGWGKARDAIAALIEKHDISLVHTHDPQSNVLVGVGRDRWPCAVVCSPYGWWTRMFPLRSHVYQWAERNWALPNADHVVTVSQDMKRKILRGRTPKERVHVVYTGLEPDSVTGGASREAVREQLGIPPDACVVGAVSRIYVEKGHAYLIEALYQLADVLPALHLLIVGEGPLRARLEHQAADYGLAERTHFTGFYNDLPGALRAMDIFAQPSILDEGFPTAVLEAQLAGLPVIASNVGGTGETMDVGTTGLLVPRRDAHALADAVRTLAEDPERRKAMGAAGPEWIKRSFTLDNMIRQVSNVYDKAVAEYRERTQDR